MAIKVKYCHRDLGEFDMILQVNLPWQINSKICHVNKTENLPWDLGKFAMLNKGQIKK